MLTCCSFSIFFHLCCVLFPFPTFYRVFNFFMTSHFFPFSLHFSNSYHVIVAFTSPVFPPYTRTKLTLISAIFLSLLFYWTEPISFFFPFSLLLALSFFFFFLFISHFHVYLFSARRLVSFSVTFVLNSRICFPRGAVTLPSLFRFSP